MSWKNILKAKWSERGDKYATMGQGDKPREERVTGKPYSGMLNEQIINDMAKDLNLPKGNYDLESEDAIFVKLVSESKSKYSTPPSGKYPSDVFYQTSIELDIEVEFHNLNVIEENTGKVIHTFAESDIILEKGNVEIQLGENTLDFEVVDYHNGKLYVEIVNGD